MSVKPIRSDTNSNGSIDELVSGFQGQAAVPTMFSFYMTASNASGAEVNETIVVSFDGKTATLQLHGDHDDNASTAERALRGNILDVPGAQAPSNLGSFNGTTHTFADDLNALLDAARIAFPASTTTKSWGDGGYNPVVYR